MSKLAGGELVLRFVDILALIDAVSRDHDAQGNLSSEFHTAEIVAGLDKSGKVSKVLVEECLFSAAERAKAGKFFHPMGKPLSAVIKNIEKMNGMTFDKQTSLLEKK